MAGFLRGNGKRAPGGIVPQSAHVSYRILLNTDRILRPPLRSAAGAMVRGGRIPPSAPPRFQRGHGVSGTQWSRRQSAHPLASGEWDMGRTPAAPLRTLGVNYLGNRLARCDHAKCATLITLCSSTP